MIRVGVTGAALVLTTVVDAAEVRLAAGPPFRPALAIIIPAFEKASGHKVSLDVVNGGPLVQQGAQGKPFDATIQTASDIEAMAKAGLIAEGSASNYILSSVGLAVRAGAPRPDISTPEALRQTLLNAKSIGRSAGASGVAFMDAARRLGVEDAIKSKVQLASGPVGAGVARGDVELGAQQYGELLPVSGIDIVGLLPAAVSPKISYRLATSAKPGDAAAMKALVDYLKSAAATNVMKDAGYDPNLTP